MTLEDLIEKLLIIQNSDGYEEGTSVVLTDDSGRHFTLMSNPSIKELKTKESFKKEPKKVVVIQ